MGTTQRILPGVPGEPNWGDLNKSITHIAKTIEKEKSDEANPDNKTPEEVAREYKKLAERRTYHINAAFRNLVKTGGGAKRISSGKSSSIGKAGIKSSRKIVRFFSQVQSHGFQQALNSIGFGNLVGKSINDVIDYLLVYCAEANTGMDETAANKASCEVLNEIVEQSGNDLDKFEQLLKDYVDGTGLSDLLCRFWGYYIFEHLSQRFQEKITQQRGESTSSGTFKIIKDDILGRIKILNESRPVAQIDWMGKEGEKEIESIFASIITILYGTDNN